MKRASAPITLVVALLAAGAFFACSSPERELRKAKAAGTVEALDAFLAKHPDGPLAEQAKDAKEQLVFGAAKTANTIAAYEDFLKRYPSGKLAGNARAAIEELHFKVAQTGGTIEAYETFLRQHPQGDLAKKAGQALDGLLPGNGIFASAEVLSTEPDRCTVRSAVRILHRSGTLNADTPPTVAPGVMNCAGMVGTSGVEIEKTELVDPNHTVVHLKSFSTAGWGTCGGGTCTVRFSVMGQEHVVSATYK
jgi:hypothetical protein